MLKQLRPLSMMLALAAVLPAAQASVLTCDFNDIKLTTGNSLAGMTDSCNSKSFAITFGSGAFLGVKGDGATATEAAGYNDSQYVRGSTFVIEIAAGISVDSLTLDLAKPSAGSAEFKIDVEGSNGRTIPPITFPNGTGSEFTWVFDQAISPQVGLIQKLTFSSSSGAAIDNLRFSLTDAPSVIPEPSLFGLTALALAAAGFAGRRRQQRSA
jgi:hypothetical protein